ncbi:MAG: hypothetical protein ACI88A_000584 [Paraglaciecola sp.]|jgi:hypothetical protein
MEDINILSLVNAESRPSKSKTTKGKWREIEAIHDRYKLRQELQELGMSSEDELNAL